MIIQCDKCSAKFRFDDALMREEGVWVRCGLCRHEFFQSHPLASPGAPPAKGRETGVEEIPLENRAEMPNATPQKKSLEPDISGDHPAPARSGKGRTTSLLRILVVLILTLAAAAGVGFLTFPDIGRQVIGDLSAYLPWLEKEKPPSLEEGIKPEAINQRFVINVTTGKLRVIEGIAVNQSGHPVARLQVKATLVDMQNNLLGEKRAYAGHVLSDAELMVLTEEEMNRRLANPAGSTASNDRILPGGRIPFMIVWAFEPPGAAKTFVTVVGVERLLQ